MSDRPMRLKYLTKMKIILCIFLLCITVSVFGQSVELNGTLGESVKFPAAVKKGGGLMHSGTTIGNVTSGSFTAGKFGSRLRWDSSTGLFSISGLKMEDSGEYKVQNTDQNINTVFQLNVYIPVLKPHLSVTRNEYRCTVLCAAARGTGATLTLYREGETNPYVTSPVRSHPDLNMTETVESGTYTCEAKNSVSRQTSDPLTVEAHCTAPSSLSTEEIVFSVIAAVLIFNLIAVLIYLMYWPSARPSRGIVGLVIFLIVALIADLICFLYFSSSTGTIVVVAFVILALIAVFISLLRSYTENELEDTENELEDTKSKLKELRGRAKRNEKPKTKKGCATS